MKTITKLTFLALVVTAGLGACATDDGVASTTSTVATSTSTTAATTTSVPAATTTTTTTMTTTTVAGPPPIISFIGQTERGDIVSVSLETGEVERTIVPVGDGWMGYLRLAPDGGRIYTTLGHEDYWFSCESSYGDVIEVNVARGVIEDGGAGFSPVPSADGSRLLLLKASQCLPDPEQPEFWVLAPADTIVVRDLATGAESERTVPLPGDQPSLDNEFVSAVWDATSNGAYVLDRSWALHHFTLAGDSTGTQQLITQLPGGETTSWWLVGNEGPDSDSLIAFSVTWKNDQPWTEVYRIAADGTMTLLYEAASSVGVALDQTGEHLLIVDGTTAIYPGGQVTLAEPITNVAW